MKISTVKDVASFLSVKESTIYSWVSSGCIPSFKVNGLVRFDMEEIEGWVRNSKMMKKESALKTRKRKGNQNVDMLIKRAIQSER